MNDMEKSLDRYITGNYGEDQFKHDLPHIEDVIAAMLKENTGSHFLDSGGAYGRHWEKNQSREFEKEDACIINVQADEDGTITELSCMYNIYHFLCNHLDIDEFTEGLQQEFEDFNSTDKWKREAWEDVLEAFCKDKEITVKQSYYTYNFETIISQDIVVNECETEDGEEFIFLRIHQGYDARGGFGSPRIFRKMEYFEIAMNVLSAGCMGKSEQIIAGENGLFDLPETYCENNWTSDNGGCNWNYDGCYRSNRKDLFDTVRYDEETKKFFCRDCGGEVYFSVTESY